MIRYNTVTSCDVWGIKRSYELKENEREKEKESQGPSHLTSFHGFQVNHVRTVRALPVAHHTARMYIHRSCVDAKNEKDKTREEEKG